MRYAHLSPGFLSDEVRKLDTFTLGARSTERPEKGQRARQRARHRAKVVKISECRCSFSVVLRWFGPTENLLLPGVREQIVHEGGVFGHYGVPRSDTCVNAIRRLSWPLPALYER